MTRLKAALLALVAAGLLAGDQTAIAPALEASDAAHIVTIC